MKLSELSKQLGYPLLNSAGDEGDVSAAYTSDLLSDVMANAPEDSVLITIQGHKNTVAVSGLAGIRGVILCNGRSAPEDMIAAADKEGIGILSSDEDQFTVSCAVGRILDIP